MPRGIRHTPESFTALLRPNGDCLEFVGPRSRTGYGHINYQSRQWAAHRLAWALAEGPIPPGLEVRHSCDNPPCCNLDHLSLGTHADNMRDVVLHGRSDLKRYPGEKNPAAKVTAAQVVEMRRLADEGLSRRALGRRFGITNQTVTKIVLRQRWKSVA